MCLHLTVGLAQRTNSISSTGPPAPSRYPFYPTFMKRPDDFKAETVRQVAERAAFICSNPKCRRITIGPDNSNQIKSTKTGIAAHICAASPGGPRYDMSQTPQQRQNISNAIWLCGTCSIMIDKNGGQDYPSDHLRKWKKDHESLIKECLEGGKRVTFQLLTLSDQNTTCRKIVRFLDDKGALFVELDYEIPHYVFDSIKEIRTFLVGINAEINESSPLEVIVESIINACRHFMNTTNPTMTITEMAYGLGAMRKIIGLNLADMKRVYGVNLTQNLESILPTY